MFTNAGNLRKERVGAHSRRRTFVPNICCEEIAFLEEVCAGYDVGHEICALANHCAGRNGDDLVKDVLEAIEQHRYHFCYSSLDILV